MFSEYKERMQGATIEEAHAETRSHAFKTMGWACGWSVSTTLLVLEAKGILPGSTLEIVAEASAFALSSVKAVSHTARFNIAESRLAVLEDEVSHAS